MNLNDEYRHAFETELPRPVDRRRRKPDKIMSIMKIFALIGWLSILAGLYVSHFAFPQQTTVLDIYRDNIVRRTWQPDYLFYALYMIAAGFVLSIVAFFLNRRRLRRKSDKLSIVVIAGIIVSTVSFVIIGGIIVSSGF